jgi:hypothetical protein
VTQNAFNEGGANWHGRIVQSRAMWLRTIFSADPSGSIGIGGMSSLDLYFQLGWQHDYANTARAHHSGVRQHGAAGTRFRER